MNLTSAPLRQSLCAESLSMRSLSAGNGLAIMDSLMFGLSQQLCGMRAEKKEQLVTFAGSARFVTNGYSDDVEYGTTAPIMTTCGQTKKHDDGTEGRFVLFW